MGKYKDGKEAKIGDFVKFREGNEVHYGRIKLLHDEHEHPGKKFADADIEHVIHEPRAVVRKQALSECILIHREK